MYLFMSFPCVSFFNCSFRVRHRLTLLFLALVIDGVPVVLRIFLPARLLDCRFLLYCLVGFVFCTTEHRFTMHVYSGMSIGLQFLMYFGTQLSIDNQVVSVASVNRKSECHLRLTLSVSVV